MRGCPQRWLHPLATAVTAASRAPVPLGRTSSRLDELTDLPQKPNEIDL
jgi:hypothetical protein